MKTMHDISDPQRDERQDEIGTNGSTSQQTVENTPRAIRHVHGTKFPRYQTFGN
jgi:hypothetical protein